MKAVTKPAGGASAQVHELKQAPHSLQAEMAVLGGLMLDASAFAKVGNSLAEADFFVAKHRFIYRAIKYLSNRGEFPDVVTVADFLEARGHRQQVDLAYLGLLAKETPSAANVGAYARIVKDFSIRRRGIQLATRYAALFYDPAGVPAEELLKDLANAAFVLQQEADAHDG